MLHDRYYTSIAATAALLSFSIGCSQQSDLQSASSAITAMGSGDAGPTTTMLDSGIATSPSAPCAGNDFASLPVTPKGGLAPYHVRLGEGVGVIEVALRLGGDQTGAASDMTPTVPTVTFDAGAACLHLADGKAIAFNGTGDEPGGMKISTSGGSLVITRGTLRHTFEQLNGTGRLLRSDDGTTNLATFTYGSAGVSGIATPAGTLTFTYVDTRTVGLRLFDGSSMTLKNLGPGAGYSIVTDTATYSVGVPDAANPARYRFSNAAGSNTIEKRTATEWQFAASDAPDRVTTFTVVDDKTVSVKDADGGATDFTFDAQGDLARLKTGAVIRAFDRGKPTSETRTEADGAQSACTASYDDKGRPLGENCVITAAGGMVTTHNVTTVYGSTAITRTETSSENGATRTCVKTDYLSSDGATVDTTVTDCQDSVGNKSQTTAVLR